jgi:hypothetical protein
VVLEVVDELEVPVLEQVLVQALVSCLRMTKFSKKFFLLLYHTEL